MPEDEFYVGLYFSPIDIFFQLVFLMGRPEKESGCVIAGQRMHILFIQIIPPLQLYALYTHTFLTSMPKECGYLR